MGAERFDSWRRTVTAAALLGLALALGFAALVGAAAAAWLVVTRPVLAVVAFAVGLWLVLRRQGGLAALGAALWHIGSAWGWRPRTADRPRLTGKPEDRW